MESWMETWVERLERHHREIRATHPDDELMMLLDVDGTFFDVRYAIHYVLQQYDQVHRTSYFTNVALLPNDTPTMSLETMLGAILLRSNVPMGKRGAVSKWFHKNCWSYDVLVHGHQPCEGTFELVRAVASRASTHIGLNSSRPEILRQETLQTLNTLAADHHLTFTSEQLFMHSGTWVGNVPFVKLAGLKHFQNKGYRVFAVLDSERENLHAIKSADGEGGIMTLDTRMVLKSYRDTAKLRYAREDGLTRYQQTLKPNTSHLVQAALTGKS